MIFGDSTGTLAALLDKLIVPISFVPVGLAVWLWHWRVLTGRQMPTANRNKAPPYAVFTIISWPPSGWRCCG